MDTNSCQTLFKSDQERNIISSDNFEFSLSLRREDILDPKDFKKFIRSCEAGIRRSPEYSDFCGFVRETLGIFKCQITGEIHSQTSCEIHHYPYSLFDITEAVISKHIDTNKHFCSFDICTEIIELHYQMKIPFIFLLKSLHEKHHSGFLKLPVELCHGDLKWFIENHKEYMESETLERIYDKMAINFENCGWKSGEYPWIDYE